MSIEITMENVFDLFMEHDFPWFEFLNDMEEPKALLTISSVSKTIVTTILIVDSADISNNAYTFCLETREYMKAGELKTVDIP